MFVASPGGGGGIIKIGIVCNIMKIFCFPFTFLLGSLISCLSVQAMWMTREKYERSTRGISLPLATVNEWCP